MLGKMLETGIFIPAQSRDLPFQSDLTRWRSIARTDKDLKQRVKTHWMYESVQGLQILKSSANNLHNNYNIIWPSRTSLDVVRARQKRCIKRHNREFMSEVALEMGIKVVGKGQW